MQGREISYGQGIRGRLHEGLRCVVLLKDECGLGGWSGGGSADGRREARPFPRREGRMRQMPDRSFKSDKLSRVAY